MSEEGKGKIPLLERMENERIFWQREVDRISKMLLTMEDLALAQVEIYSSLSRVDEVRRKYIIILAKKQQESRENKANALDEIYSSQNYYTAPEKKMLLEAQTTKDIYTLEILDDHINAIGNFHKIFSDMVYGVKNRIEIEKYKSGMLFTNEK